MNKTDQAAEPSLQVPVSPYRWVLHLLIVLFILFGIFTRYNKKKAPLSTDERAWVNSNEILLIEGCHFPPIEFLDGVGDWDGISHDYIELIEKRLGFTFTRKHICNSSESIKAISQETPSVKCNVQKTPERRIKLQFTDPYLLLPNAIIVRNEMSASLHLAELKNETIAWLRLLPFRST